MSDHKPDTRTTPSLAALLGYLNFSEGRPDPRVPRALDDLASSLPAATPPAPPWEPLHQALRHELDRLRAAGGPFADSAQADAVLELTLGRLLPAYRRHHADLLAHQPDAALFTPFFITRAFEAVLAQGRPWDETDRIVRGALRTLNDFVGHRPIAILETRPKGEPYDHERVRPVPLCIRDAGVARGPYHDLVARALDVLTATDPDLLDEAAFDPRLLDELAFDPRAYDFDHPVHRRPNYLFGEWDPHHIDNQGRYRRCVVRQVVLDSLLERIAAAPSSTPAARDEALTEAAVVVAGTLLMATATSGRGPVAHDSATTLGALLPRIARLRDAFYERTLQRLASQGPHGARLRQEAVTQRQPFASIRQYLNARLAALRATQVQQRFLALLYADMGFPEAARAEAARIPVPSVRLTTELHGMLIHADRLAAAGDLPAARPLLGQAFALLRRGIACGAFADPWNILGFQALFPVSPAREDAVRDPRAHELVVLVERLLTLHAHLLAEAGARGRDDLFEPFRTDMHALAVWWDRFATPTVSEVRTVYGMEALTSAEAVSEALARWHKQGQARADLAFWRELLPGFGSPKAFALVLDSLLEHADFQAALGLLVAWLSQADKVPLDGGEHSFHALALRWMLGVTASSLPPDRAWPLVRRFLDSLEANAEALGQVPALEEQPSGEDDDEEDNPFQAAYEGVTYQDSTDDDEGAVADGGEPRERFSLEDDSERLLTVLQFLTTQARLWALAARFAAHSALAGQAGAALEPAARVPSLTAWLHTAQGHLLDLLELLDAVQDFPVPTPEGGFDSMVEFDRRRTVKLRVLHAVVGTALETEMAIGALLGSLPRDSTATAGAAPWVGPALDLEQAILRRDPAAARTALAPFLAAFQAEPLLFTAVEEGGDARAMLRARLAQTVLRALAVALPRLGLLRETHLLLRTALGMERALPGGGRGITEFNTLFQAAFQGVVECLGASAASWPADQAGDPALVHRLDTLCSPFVALWMEHSRGLHLSALEAIRTEKDWIALRDFIRRYGRDLFDVRFLTLGNLRGLLHQGLDPWLNHLLANPDPLHPIRLVEDIERGPRHGLDRNEALVRLRLVVQAVAENYDEYRDFNTTSARAAYGDNLYVLLDFLRLKAAYERHAWQLRPLVLAHDVLARHGRTAAAHLWQEQMTRIVREPSTDHLKRLAELEKEHATTIRTISDRLHEKFVAPLALDRLAALVEPAMKEARAGGPHATFDRFREGLVPFTSSPGGVGLDVPPWLRRLQGEVQRVHHARTPVAALAETTLTLPQRLLTLDEFNAQFLPGGGLDV